MTRERFVQLVETYGSDLRTWPHPEREDGAEFMTQSAEAKLIWREAQTLDRLLQESAPEPAADWLVDRIVSRAQGTPQLQVAHAAWRERNIPSWAYSSLQAAAFAGVFLLGMALGLTVLSRPSLFETQPDIVSLVYESTRMGGWAP